MRDSREIQVLVVDDDLALCELLRTTFELEGIKILEAHHVIEAERLLIGTRPDAIVLDIGLPGVDGIFYLERLRESLQTRTMPIVAISGSQEAGVRAISGANAFVGKPFDPINLLATLERLVGVSPADGARPERARRRRGGPATADPDRPAPARSVAALLPADTRSPRRRPRDPPLRHERAFTPRLRLRNPPDARGQAVAR